MVATMHLSSAETGYWHHCRVRRPFSSRPSWYGNAKPSRVRIVPSIPAGT